MEGKIIVLAIFSIINYSFLNLLHKYKKLNFSFFNEKCSDNITITVEKLKTAIARHNKIVRISWYPNPYIILIKYPISESNKKIKNTKYVKNIKFIYFCIK